MLYIESKSTDPYFNLALEEYVFETLSAKDDFFMLWQNDNTIVVGKHQNTIGEIRSEYVKEKDIKVVRRLSGGGAVYHDLGNLNFTFITSSESETVFDFSSFCKPVVDTLNKLGVEAKISGRNDMEIAGKKFSGNSQYAKGKKILHHGTILFDSDLSILGVALKPSKDKFISKGLKSVGSRVTNIKPFLGDEWTLKMFKKELTDHMFGREKSFLKYELTEEDLKNVEALRDQRYSTWDWNYGKSPSYEHIKERRIEGVGKIEVHMNIVKGVITDIAFWGDYFANKKQDELIEILQGQILNEENLRETLKNTEVSQFFHGISNEDFISLLLI